MEALRSEEGRIPPYAGVKMSNAEIEARIRKIIRWAGYIAKDLPSDHLVYQLAHDALDMLVGSNALHTNASFKSSKKRLWAEELLSKTIQEAKLH